MYVARRLWEIVLLLEEFECERNLVVCGAKLVCLQRSCLNFTSSSTYKENELIGRSTACYVIMADSHPL